MGATNDSTVVVLDRKYDATRLWWLLQYFGHTQARVLDGGMQRWLREGRPTTLEQVDFSLCSRAANSAGGRDVACA